MTAHHGGGLIVVAEGGDAVKDEFVVYDINGRLPPEVASFDFRDGKITFRPAKTHDGAAGGKTANMVVSQTNIPYERYFGFIPSKQIPDAQALADLGEALRFNATYAEDESATPVAYSYFGQFVFHDLSAMVDPGGHVKPYSERTASLDLDSVFGEADPMLTGPATPMAVGPTASQGRPYDLPRAPDGTASISDLRNDDNLPLAQTHMAVIRLFNAIVAGCPGVSHVEARELAVTHFQSVVLHDYLTKVVDGGVYYDVMSKGRAVIHTAAHKLARLNEPFRYMVPLEFAAACARFGHSMMRNNYFDWNARNANGRLFSFWSNTYNSSVPPFDGTPDEPRVQLPDRWVAQWGKLLDGVGLPPGQAPLMAAKIDTILADPLKAIPDDVLPELTRSLQTPVKNLAGLSLLRARSLQLSTAQSVAQTILPPLAARGSPTFAVLTDQDLGRNEPTAVKTILQSHFSGNTPLWFYTLKEAEVVNFGQRLGPLGSRIVMETVHAAIEESSPSILAGNWQPDPRLQPSTPDKYTLPDLIAFSGLYNT